jgi:calcineurin-like phosphoesterase family protein
MHLNHEKINEYGNRPFKSTHEMNETLIANWNKTVGKEDTVYFLGDLCFETKEKKKEYWLNRLNGHIIWVKGNHDHFKGLIDTIYFDSMFMIHDPWGCGVGHRICIHGHQHNKGKLIDKRHKRICVSMELIDYKPIELKVILDKYHKTTTHD